ncbi:MAG: hypothetical protein LIO81_03405 [Clostridiales bacterium]|nr:hypothetical protein [Clostridiales bacterium]
MKGLNAIRIAGALIAISAVLFFANAYRLEALGMIQTDVLAITDRGLAGDLQSGIDADDADAGKISLKSFSAAEMVYRRGSNLYVGDSRTRIESNYPFFTADGTALWYFNENGTLITDDFMSFESYQGLFVSDGTAFDAEGVETTDEDTYIFAGLTNGLYINTVPVTIEKTDGSENEIRMNSVVCFEEGQLRFYRFDSGSLVYDAMDSLADAVVVIRGERYAYGEFLSLLGIGGDTTAAASQKSDETENDPAQEGGSDNTGEDDSSSDEQMSGLDASDAADGNESGNADGRGDGAGANEEENHDSSASAANITATADGTASYAEGLNEAALTDVGLDQDSDTSGEEADISGDTETNDDRISSDGTGSGGSGGSGGIGGSGDSGGSGGSGGSDGAGGSSGSSGSGGSATNSGSGAGNGSGSGGDESDDDDDDDDSKVPGSTTTTDDDAADDGESDGSGEAGDAGDGNAVEKPTVSIGAVTAGVYNLDTTLYIEDPDNRLKRVVFRVYYDNDGTPGTQITRKNFKKAGEISIVYVNPGTSVWLEGTFVWLDDSGEKQTEYFMDNILLKTLPIEGNVKDIVYEGDEAETYQSSAISIQDIVLSSEDDNTSLSYISRAVLTVKEEGTTGTTTEIYITGSTLRSMKSGNAYTWTSDKLFDSGKTYNWTLEFYDRFGNLLPTDPETISGTAYTSYVAPTASVALVSNGVNLQRIRVLITNPDAEYIGLKNCYVEVSDYSTGTVQTKLSIGTESDVYELTNLPAGKNFRIRVYGTYNIRDSKNAQAQVGLMGQTTFYTASISNLGYFYYDISVLESSLTYNSATVQAKINSSTNTTLISLLTKITVTLSDAAAGSTAVTLEKDTESAYIYTYPVTEDGYYLIQEGGEDEPDVVLLVSEGSEEAATMTAWEAIQNWKTFELRYPAGKFASNTSYTVTLGATVTQGGSTYSVGASTNSASFLTLKRPPALSWDQFLLVSDFVEIHGLYIDDPDGTITDGRVNMRLYAAGRLVSTQIIHTNQEYGGEDEDYPMISYTSLLASTDYTIQFYCSEYNEGHTSDTAMTSYHLSDFDYSFTTGEGLTGKVELTSLDYDEEKDDGSYLAGIHVVISDLDDSLGDEKSFVLRYRREEGIDVGSDFDVYEEQSYTFDAGTYYYDETIAYSADAWYSYEVELVVTLLGSEVVLDSVSFETDQPAYTITKESDFAQTSKTANLTAKFIVLNDIECTTGSSYGGSGDSIFNGVIDFQGYKLIRTSSSASALFSYLGSSGVIKNVEVDYTAATTQTLTDKAALVWRNYGTIQNVAVHINFSGRHKHNVGGIVSSNYTSGVIENFVVDIASDWYVGGSSGGVASSNNGTIRNGYVYGSDIIVGSGVSGGKDGTRSSTGAIAGSNGDTGLIYNAFTLVDVVHEESSSAASSVALAVGSNSGRVRNVYSSGDRYSYTYDDNGDEVRTSYTGYSSVIGGGTMTNIYHYSELGETYSNQTYNKNVSTITARGLRSTTWHEELFNGEGQFNATSLVQAGCYPQVILPDSMGSLQETISLPLVSVSAYPDLIGGTITAEGTDSSGDYVEMDLEFYNTNGYPVSALTIDGLSVEILDGQGTGDSNYIVPVRLRATTKYTSSYEATSVSYRSSLTSSIVYTQNYSDHYISVSFYKPVETVDDWISIDDNTTYNYRLQNDLDFSGAYENDYRIDSTFTGILDGNGHTISNVSNTVEGSLFASVSGGTIKNLTVEGLTLSTASTKRLEGSMTGLIKETSNNAVLSHIHIVGVDDADTVEVYAYGGALAGKLVYTTVTDCSVTNMNIETVAFQNNTLWAGGLIGYATTTEIANCYANGIAITATDGSAANGIGGLVGLLTSSCSLKYAYAAGTIETNLQNVGGLVGRSSCNISNVWTKVDIRSVSDVIGGIVGRAASSISVEKALEIGDLYTTVDSSAIGRLVGTSGSSSVSTRYTVGYEGQLFGAESSEDADDVASLVSLDELWTRVPYRDYAVLGSYFDISGKDTDYTAEDGYMPLLYDSDEELMPEQEDVLLPDPDLSISVTCEENTDGSGTYKITVTIATGSYEISSVMGSGFDLGNAEADTFVSITNAAGKRVEATRRVYSAATLVEYKDSYSFQAVLTKGSASQTLTVIYTPETPFSHKITNAAEWFQQMTEYGQNYENFEAYGEIDLSTYSGELSFPTQLKINRLIGNMNAVVKNKSMTASAQGESMIAVISGELTDISFENMSLEVPSNYGGGKYVGLIGTNNGTIEGVSFKGITINGYNSSYVGCIGINNGTITTVTLEDIKVSAYFGDTTLSSTPQYWGGLAGYSTGGISYVTATASASGAYSVNNDKASYVGGIIGYQTGGRAEQLSVAGISVSGVSYVGGLIGYMGSYSGSTAISGYTVGTRTEGADDAATADTSGILQTTVSGTGSCVGGAFGQSAISDKQQPLTVSVYNTTVKNSGSNTGGIAGQAGYLAMKGRLEDVTVAGTGNYVGGAIGVGGYNQNIYINRATISGASYVGGICGRPYGSGSTSMVIMNSTVKASGNYVGGINGYYSSNSYPAISQDGVYKCTISGTNYVGGVVGRYYGQGIYRCYVNECTITGSNYVGGVVGEARGSHYYALSVNATVSAEESYAGMLAGRAYSYYVDISNMHSYMDLLVKGSYFTGSVYAWDEASGLIGIFMEGEDPTDSGATVESELTAEHFYGNVLALDSITVGNGTTSTSGLLAYVNGKGSDAGTVGTSKLWVATLWNGDNAQAILTGTDSGAYRGAIKDTGITLTDSSKLQDSDEYADMIGAMSAVYFSTGELPTYMPYLTYTWTDAVTSETHSMANFEHYIKVPLSEMTVNTVSLLASYAVLTGEEMSIYPVSAGAINLELGEDPGEGVYTLTIADTGSGAELLTVPVTGQVTTISYDFQTPVTAYLYTDTEMASFDIDPEAVARTVMVDGDDYYYLTSGGVGTANKEVIDGDFIHIYKGEAIDIDGQVTKLGSHAAGAKDVNVGSCELLETTPLYTGTYYKGIYTLDAYWNFTDSYKTDGTDEKSVISGVMVVKGGCTYNVIVDDMMASDSWIFDVYNNKSYHAVLNTSGSIENMGVNDIYMPDDFVNSGIVEISDTLDSDSTLVVGRRSDGSVFCFDYLSGEEQNVIETETTTSLLTYAANWVSSKTAAMTSAARASYLSATSLADDYDLAAVNEAYAELTASATIADYMSGDGTADGTSSGSDTISEGSGSGDASGGGDDDSGIVTADLDEDSDSTGTSDSAEGSGAESAAEATSPVITAGSTDTTSNGTGSSSGTGSTQVTAESETAARTQTEQETKAVITASQSEEETEEASASGISTADEDEDEDEKTGTSGEKLEDEEEEEESSASSIAETDKDGESDETSSVNKTDDETSTANETDDETSEAATAGEDAGASESADGQTDGSGEDSNSQDSSSQDSSGEDIGGEDIGGEDTGSGTEEQTAVSGQAGAESDGSGTTDSTAVTNEETDDGSITDGDDTDGDSTENGAADTSGESEEDGDASEDGTSDSDGSADGDGSSDGSTGNTESAENDGNTATDSANGDDSSDMDSADGISTADADASENGEQTAAISGNNTALSQSGLEKTYLTIYNTKSGAYEVYNAAELLEHGTENAVSMNEKIAELERQGVDLKYAQINNKVQISEDEAPGVALYAGATLLIIFLLINLWMRRRKLKK